MRRRPQIAVVGAGEAGAELLEAAEQVGAGLAHAGAVLVCGGLGGVMEAACRGAREAGGLTVGLLPGTDRGAANPFLDVAVPTGMGEMRNAVVVRAGEAVIAVGGGFGTLAEIGLALKARTPVVGIATWEAARAGRAIDEVERVESAAEAVERALALAHAKARRD
jgi:uncharacterized protein (TIGR00725 family)